MLCVDGCATLCMLYVQAFPDYAAEELSSGAEVDVDLILEIMEGEEKCFACLSSRELRFDFWYRLISIIPQLYLPSL